MRDFLLGGTLGADGSIAWTSPDWVVVMAVAGALVAFLASLPAERPWSRRLLEAALWGAALALLVVALARPVWVEESGRTEAARVAVLVDGSASMGILEQGRARSDSVAGILAHVDDQVDRVEVFTFGDELLVGAPDTFELPGTDLRGALDAVSERFAGERLGAVVVITDGLDRGGLRRAFEDPDPRVPLLGGPLTVFGVGEAGDLKDLAVRAVDTGGYAFLRSPFQIKADIEGAGFEGQVIKATLLADGLPITTKSVKLDDAGDGQVAFEITPDRAGRFAYEVSVPQYESDAVPANNTMPVVVRVVRDKIRILQVAGAPSWDVKFLRRFLKGDPSVDLVSFFILRTNRDMDARYTEDELSLIAFPYRDLFSTDLWSFDVVIFQNFDYEPFFGATGSGLLENMRKYVEEDGGAVVMVGGDRSFGLGRYGNTPLGDVLPVISDNDERPSLDTFQPRLTNAGARHPLSRLVPDQDENAAWWGRLHAMDGTNVVGTRNDSTVLLEHPSLKDVSGQPLPVLSVREAGQGRTMALTVDSSWRWSMSEAALGRGNQAYLRFWKNSLRWLMRDASVSRVTVETGRENYSIGDEVKLVVRANDTGFAPLPGAAVTVAVDRGGEVATFTGVTTASGEVVVTVPAARRGTHKVAVEVLSGTSVVGTAETVYAVTARDPELDEVRPDGEFLAALASRAGGVYHPPGTLGPVRVDAEAGRQVFDRRETPIWRAPLLLGLIGLLAGLAWMVRRRAGLR